MRRVCPPGQISTFDEILADTDRYKRFDQRGSLATAKLAGQPDRSTSQAIATAPSGRAVMRFRLARKRKPKLRITARPPGERVSAVVIELR